ncbi:waprin-Thr1-like [Temnothorax curvispinosus]|uniref:Waprin-Thr1-like n=2 Tax=Temnothorax TaxID=300110 RepID=A0A6J1RGD7_9HYME|nr:waprin-Thr1-like [Temnothorax curvispinosus]TGZ52835.1 WAP, kazal, immunoglobulin, kunitz and NTR domain-containing protein [Temnothorax longispinosus]
MNRSLLAFAVVLILLVAGTFSQTFYKSGNCPMRNTVSNCGSRCIGDGQCPFNQKCCPNKCGFTSCADTSPVNTGSDGGYKGSSNQQAVYCNGVKCAAYEKCQYDRNTRRDKCTRV